MSERVPAPSEIDRDAEWQRLDRRMLLVHPVREVVRFIPALLAIVVAGRSAGGPPWELLGVAVPVALGVLRYLTTTFRIHDGRVELRRGLLNKHVLSAPLDRVRTVDLTSSPVHRVLGLTTVRIGTGTASTDGDERLDLDGLPADRATALRHDLLALSLEATSTPDSPGTASADELVRFDLRWLRFAPYSSGGLIITAAFLGACAQLMNTFGLWERIHPEEWSLPLPVGVAVAGGVVLLIVVMLGLSLLGYLVTNWDFRLTRSGGAWHLSRGLLTTRETSIDEERLAGVCLGEPLALRLAGGRGLQAIVTGVDRKQRGSSVLVPSSDRDVAPRVGAAVLGTRSAFTTPLRRHGAAATKRRWARALVPAAMIALAPVIGVLLGAPPWTATLAVAPLAVGVTLAVDRSRGLGHALVDRHLVARSGSLTRHRVVLGTDHIIGWTFRSTWFQRRAGLTTLSATTAGGNGSVTVLDITDDDAYRLADDALPALVAQFRA